jgi:hypothetical protein
MSRAFSRRAILAALGAAAALLPAMRPAQALVAAPDPAARLVGLFKHPASARAIGAVYLAGHPEEADARRLIELVIGADGDPPAIRDMSDPELRAWLRGRLARDFATERIVKLDGWLLAATEVRLCALVALA